MVTLGSACTGWCSEVQACELLNVKYVHKFACDINPQARKLNEENFDVQRMHHDVLSKEFSNEVTVDKFSAGFPLPTLQRHGRTCRHCRPTGGCREADPVTYQWCKAQLILP